MSTTQSGKLDNVLLHTSAWLYTQGHVSHLEANPQSWCWYVLSTCLIIVACIIYFTQHRYALHIGAFLPDTSAGCSPATLICNSEVQSIRFTWYDWRGIGGGLWAIWQCISRPESGNGHWYHPSKPPVCIEHTIQHLIY